jgi:hypothetical protein
MIIFEDGGPRLTMLSALIVVLSMVEMLLEVDVALTKIEMFHNLHLCLSSSAVASWLIPELFFIGDELLERFPMLKYGISSLLVYFGLEMLFADLIVVPQFWNCLIMICILSVSAALPDVASCSSTKAGEQLLTDNQRWETESTTDSTSANSDECTWDCTIPLDAGLIGRTVRATPPGKEQQQIGIVTDVMDPSPFTGVGKLQVRFDTTGAKMVLPLGHKVEVQVPPAAGHEGASPCSWQ